LSTAATRKVWVAGGRYFIRLAKVNPAMKERHARHVERGWLVHERTEGDVAVFKVMPGAPFFVRKKARDERWLLMSIDEASKLLAAGDLQLFVDLAEELAEFVKTAGKSRGFYAALMGEIETKALKRGADPMVRDQVKMVMRERREQRAGTVLVLPPTAVQ
jgi:hypothetical protein